MPHRANVKVMVAAGASPRDAIKAALPSTFADFADRHGFAASHVSRCINGVQRHEAIRAALARELGVDRAWLDTLLDGVSSPKPEAADAGGSGDEALEGVA